MGGTGHKEGAQFLWGELTSVDTAYHQYMMKNTLIVLSNILSGMNFMGLFSILFGMHYLEVLNILFKRNSLINSRDLKVEHLNLFYQHVLKDFHLAIVRGLFDVTKS